MKITRQSLILFLCLLGMLSYAQQITTNSSQSLQALIQENFAQGCVEISNISSQINGSVNNLASFGSFERASSSFPFENGIVLTTGSVGSAGNVEVTAALNEGNLSWGTDPDLENALGISNTFNATSVQFDFISAANTIQFNYLLASEEYQQEYPCFYSDGFAFLIREAGTNNPFTNIALIPGTNIPVNTNTIHGDISGFCDAENGEFFEGNNIGDTNYNGRTVVMTATASIQPNVTYQIKMIIADQTDQNADSAVFIEGNSFDAVVDLGPDITTCGTSVELNGDIQNNLATYQWFRNDVLIANALNPELTVTLSGTYRIEVTIPINDTECVIEDEVLVTLNSEQEATPIADYHLCDTAPIDGIEVFDLSTMDAEVLGSVSPGVYDLSYHYSQEDAESGSNPITSPIANSENPQQIFVRILDPVNGCLAYNSFSLVVNPLPNLEAPSPFVLCGEGGVADFDLFSINNEVTAGNTNLNVSYHETEAEATNGLNPILPPYQNINNPQDLYVRVVDSGTGCFNTTTLTLEVIQPPTVTTDAQWLNACDLDGNGFSDFDLTEIITDLLQGLTGVTVTFHETEEDAENGENAVADDTSYQNLEPDFQMLYIRIEDDATGCFVVRPLELHTNLTQSGFDLDGYVVCDDASGDGIADFDLQLVEEDIVNGYDGFTLTFFETETDMNSNSNPLDINQAFTVSDSATIYIRVDGNGCTDFIEVELTVSPLVDIPPRNLEYCDLNFDGITSIDLFSFNAIVSQGVQPASVTYHLTEDDAVNNENVLPQFYENTTNPETLWIRVVNTESRCLDIEPITINIVSAPQFTEPSDIIVCDSDQDGLAPVDLVSKISEIVTDTSGLTFTFHDDYTESTLAENPIDDPSQYVSSTQSIYVRIENDVTGCFSIATQFVYVNTLPIFPDISPYQNCEADATNVSDFFFSIKDDEILNGQLGKQVLYFENETDAVNRQNIIDKFLAYQNISSPQTIYVRVENITDQNCFDTSSFELEVGALPIYTEPTDIFICDDISNDGLVTLDLNEKIIQISDGVPLPLDITFHESFDDADLSQNALPLTYTNSFNPQNIYVRIENGTYCHVVDAFEINVISVPSVTNADPIEQCDDNDDGFTVFDLTQIEVEILDVRQDNIEVSYHLSTEDLENNENAITNTTSYVNISNPQTVFIRVTNTISNCFLNIPLELIVNLPPEFNDFEVFEICENANDYFDLREVETVLLNDSNNILLTYYNTLSDAEIGDNQIPLDYTYSSSNDTIYVRLENTVTNCFTTYNFNLRVNPVPIANQPDNFDECDDDFDGFLSINLEDFTTDALGTQNPNQFSVTYHSNLGDAEIGSNNLDAVHQAENDEIIYIRVTNDSTGCFSITNFTVFVRPRPIVDIPNQTLCIDDLPLTVSAETGNPGDTYSWSTGQSTSTIDIFSIGTFSVTVTTEYNCMTTTEFEVIESESANIEVVETIDFSDPNNITITINGIGNYLYVLDNGTPQESNVFENVSLGYHTLRIIDLNGCAEVIKEVVVVDAPKFFTPNNDSYNDTWHIAGVETLPGTLVFIYDRYGKLLKTLGSSSVGWDGTYNGNRMPSNDYWFVANVKKDNTEFEVSGHFALKR